MIELLDALADEAVVGDVSGVAIAVMRPDGTVDACWSKTPAQKVGAMVGCIDLLKHRFMRMTEE